MNRKEFLSNFWNKVFKPILLLIVGVFCVYFLYRTIFESGNERNAFLLLTSLAFIYVLLYVIGRLFDIALERLIRKVPASLRTLLKQVLQIISPPVFLFLIYVTWKQDQAGTLILLAILLMEYIFMQPKKGNRQKQNSLNTISILIEFL